MRARISTGCKLPGALIIEPENEAEAALLHHWCAWGEGGGRMGVARTVGDGRTLSATFSWFPRAAADSPKVEGAEQ